MTLPLREAHYPFLMSQTGKNHIERVDILAEGPEALAITDPNEPDNADRKDSLVKDATFGNLWAGTITNSPLPEQPIGPLTLHFNSKKMTELWVAITWGGD